MPDPGPVTDALQALGLRLQDLVAGLAGGVVNAFVFQRSHPLVIGVSVFIGAAAAHYLGLALALATGLSASVSAYIVGLCAMALCQAAMTNIIDSIIEKAQKRD